MAKDASAGPRPKHRLAKTEAGEPVMIGCWNALDQSVEPEVIAHATLREILFRLAQ